VAIEIRLNDFLQYLKAPQGALQAFTMTMCVRLTEAQRSTEMLSRDVTLGKLAPEASSAMDEIVRSL
jgi:hypothetical protein